MRYTGAFFQIIVPLSNLNSEFVTRIQDNVNEHRKLRTNLDKLISSVELLLICFQFGICPYYSLFFFNIQ